MRAGPAPGARRLTATGGGQHSRRVRAVVLSAIAAIAWPGFGGDVRRAEAASPRAELVVTWAPGRSDVAAEAAAVAKRAGAVAVDATPVPAALEAADRAALAAGRAAYEALRFEEAVASLDAAARSVERTGGAGLTTAELADLFLYRALSAVQLGRAEPAWEDFVRAATMDPARALDPAELPPRAIEQFERARAHVAALPSAKVQLLGRADCQISVDGRAIGAGEQVLVQGRHWLAAGCPGARPVQRGFDVVAAAPMEVTALGSPVPDGGEEAALVQARALGARAFVMVTVRGEMAMLRRLGIDGREQARRPLRLPAGASLAPLGDELNQLIGAVEGGGATPWYRTRWAWAAAGVVAATAVLLPVMLLGDDGPDGVVIRPSGTPW